MIILSSVLAAATCFQTSAAPAPTPPVATPKPSAAASPAAPASESDVRAPVVAPGIDGAIRAATPEVQEFNAHMMILASPWMEGRLPGTRGFERASQYMEDHFAQYGLQPPVMKDGVPTYRQPFQLGGKQEISGGAITIAGSNGNVSLIEGEDFTLTGLGTGQTIEGAPLVFVGYGINDGPDGYTTFAETDDLSGKVAVVYRFEPMTAEGTSRWAERGWSGRSSFASKLGAVKKRKPAAVLVINPPGAADPRAKSLMRDGSKLIDVPVYMLSAEGADKLFRASDEQGRDALAMRALADEKGTVLALPKGTATLDGSIKETPVETANVVGVRPGKGALKDEYVVIGGHLDHLGMGYFGSREGGGKLHPGADDNASGSAGIIMLAKSLSSAYKDLPEGTDARSVVFMGFSAEESGLIGSAYYANNPLFPLDKTVLMMNYDMIGRIKNKRLSVSGTDTGEGMHEWLQPYFDQDKCGLKVVQSKTTGGGGSDHTSFVMKGVPVLFGIIADFHADYHTSRDTQDLINREDAVLAVKLWHDIALGAAQRPEGFKF
ncbi:MAG: M28 family peptidase, partial [Phycisphaerae bacterium]|nr:M28 family peptidase [Phycisphaerae bacterium]